MDFIQTFELNLDTCDFILSNLEIDINEKSILTVELPEIHEPIFDFLRQYLFKIEEFNYFGTISKLKFDATNTMIRYIPSWKYQMYEPGGGGNFNFFIFLVDNESIFEVFNPFIRSCFRVRPQKGLVVIFPAIWMMMFRHTDTFDKTSIFISGSLNIDNLYDMENS